MAKVKVKISHDKNTCINCNTCVVLDPENFANNNGNVVLIEGKDEDGDNVWERVVEVDESQLAKIKDGANSCPVMAIKFEILKK